VIPFASALLAAAAGPFPTLVTPQGQTLALDPSAHPATAIVFVSAVCPVANDYAIRLAELQKALAAKGVPLLLVYANRTESAGEVAANARGHEFSFPVYLDPGQQLANRLNATVTPSAFVVDRRGEVRYSGKIDDAVQPARVKRRFLREAVDAVLAGRPPEPARVEPYG